jgi:hypothetical protein
MAGIGTVSTPISSILPAIAELVGHSPRFPDLP